MPDVLTHLLIGASLALVLRRNGPRVEQMLIILGALLIDIERPVSWILAETSLDWIGLGSGFHSILGALVLSYFAASCFQLENQNFKSIFTLILIGCISHLILDMVMYPWQEYGIYLLYPVKIAFSFHLLWNDVWWYPLVGLACLVAALCIRYILRKTLDESKDVQVLEKTAKSQNSN